MQIFTETHAVIGNMPAAPELFRTGQGFAGAQGPTRVFKRMLDHGNDRPDVDVLINDDFLAGCILNNARLHGVENAFMNLKLQFLAVLATEHFGHNFIRAEHVGCQAGIIIPFDFVEHHGRAAVHALLQSRHFAFGINLAVCFQNQSVFFQPLKG